MMDPLTIADGLVILFLVVFGYAALISDIK
jgi:hypothetical protein